jgi:ribonuclease P protein component
MGIMCGCALHSLTRPRLERNFKQLTSAIWLFFAFPGSLQHFSEGSRRMHNIVFNTAENHYEQENLSAEQSPSREGARLSPAHAHPRRSRHPERSSAQGSHRTLRVVRPVHSVLARADRLVRAEDYRATVRRGRRSASPAVIAYVVAREQASGIRFGFIVSKAVGNAVVRNRVRRRLKAICFDARSSLLGPHPGLDVVLRAQPPAAAASWTELSVEVPRLIAKAVSHAGLPVKQ